MLRAVAHSGHAVLRQTCAPDAAATASFMTIATYLRLRGLRRDAQRAFAAHRLAGMQERMTAAAINQASVYQARHAMKMRPFRSGREPARAACAGQCCARHAGRSDAREGTILDWENYAIVSLRHTATLSGSRRNLPLPETRSVSQCEHGHLLFGGAPIRPHVPLRDLVRRPIRMPRSVCVSAAATHRRHRLMTYALIASKMATLISDNDQEEFSHCSASRRPQRKAAGIVLCREANAPASQRARHRGGPFGSRGVTAIRSRRRNSR